jgi:DNA-binding NtrC family response regulator
MSARPKPRSNRILIVDPELRSTRRLAALLREDGFEVEVARDALSAMQQLSCAPLPDTLITELRVPQGDGVTLARYARSLVAGLQVVVVTRYTNLVPAELGSPFRHVLGKPLDYSRLLEVLRDQPSSLPSAELRLAAPRF